jgi:hypothetical protein
LSKNIERCFSAILHRVIQKETEEPHVEVDPQRMQELLDVMQEFFPPQRIQELLDQINAMDYYKEIVPEPLNIELTEKAD